MNVRFIMYPAEIGMGPVYERLFNMEPHQRATPIKRLLGYLSSNPSLPVWFLSLPPAPIATHRQQTVRLHLSPREPDLIAVVAELEPLSEAERINYIKRVFARACAPKGQENAPLELPVTNNPVPSSKDESINPVSQPAATLADDEDEKRRKIKQSSAFFLR